MSTEPTPTPSTSKVKVKMEDSLNVPVKMPPNLDLSKENASCEWNFWLKTFEDYLAITGLKERECLFKISLLRNMMGPEAARIISTIPMQDETNYLKVVQAISDHINPRTNVVFERFKFSERKQAEGEPFDVYLTDCRHLIRTCNYKEMTEEMMRDHIVQTVFDKSTQEWQNY